MMIFNIVNDLSKDIKKYIRIYDINMISICLLKKILIEIIEKQFIKLNEFSFGKSIL
jgi:hypothetical protein